MTQKTIIFDLDGTVADTLILLLNIYNEAAPRFGCRTVDKKDIEKLRSLDPLELMRMYNVKRYKIPLMALYMRRELSKHLVEAKAFTGMPEVIKQLHDKGYKIGMLTSNSAVNALEFLTQNGLDVYFDFVYGSKRVFGKDKALAKIIKKEQLKIEDIVYVGDETRDVVACKKAGIKVVAVTWGFNSRSSLEKLHPYKIVQKQSELIQVL